MSDEDETDRDDPFDRLGYKEREGDPFERLDDRRRGDAADRDTADQSGSAEDIPTENAPAYDDPWTPPGTDGRETESRDERPERSPGQPGSTGVDVADDGPTVAPDQSASPTSTGDPDDPFANVDTPTESPFDAGESVFEHVDAGNVDPDDVWESITGEDDDEAEPSIPDEGRYSDVSKHRFCEQCEHFSPPPAVSCGHHTAEIIEFLDMETVRLLDCPVVAEREELEQDG